MSWKPFSFGEIALATLDGAVAEGSGMVYSTAPQRALGDDGEDYFVKGPDKEVVFAELAGCVLANAVGLTVPSVRACSVGGEVLAGSRLVSNLRVIAPFLQQRRIVSNFEEVFDAVVVDTWLGNTDRNMGNIIGSPGRTDLIEFVFIDFEKSVALRQFPTIKSAGIADRELWPRYELGDTLRPLKPAAPPRAMIERIRGIGSRRCGDLIGEVSDALGGIEWAGDSHATLIRRAANLEQLLRGVWN